MKRNSKLVMVLVALVLCLSMVLVGCKPSGDTSTSNSEGNSTTTSTPGSSEGSSQGSSEGTSQEPSQSTGPIDQTLAPLTSTLSYADNTVLRMATGYNSAKTGLSFTADLVDKTTGTVTLADGKTYSAGDLKPTWQEIESRLKIKITDLYQGNSASDEFTYWQDQLDKVDIVSGTATKLTEAGNAGKVVNLANYLDKMPNFKAYLDANPIVRLSITGSTIGDNTGAIYFSPYFDGVDDIERMPLMRVDFVEKLLNGEGEFVATTTTKNLAAAVYTPYMPTTGTVEVDVVKADGSGTEKLVKDYSKYGNIIAKMNAESSLTNVQAINMLREYIDKTYNGYYGTNRADLFVGQNAAWDADEMVALVRCVVASSYELNGTDTMAGIFARESSNNQRPIDMFRFAGTLFGARGLESRSDYYYFDKDGKLHDAREEVASYEAVERMNALVEEGLFASDYNVDKASGKSETFLENDNGFMSYDYNQTQTVLNATKLDNAAGEKYMAVMVPVAKWNDGTGEKYMRFTESWRSVKTDGWGLSVAGIGNDTNKLNAALKLIDYAYSIEGQILMSYGPDAFIKVKDANGTTVDAKYETFNFNGNLMPVIADATYAELYSKASGNYTNYARQFLGSTLSFVKSQAFEYQCTHEVGKEGSAILSNAIALGVINHPELTVCDNMWYTSIPTVFPTTDEENTEIASYTNLSSNGRFSQSKGKTNLFVDIISGGYAGEGTTSQTETIATAKTWGTTAITAIRQVAWDDLAEFYAGLNK